MVQEIRRVVLNDEELRSVLESYRRVSPAFLPPGKIGAFTPVNDGIQITVTFTSDNTSTNSEVTMNCAALLKPVIRFCIENNIMLPRDGRKIIEIEDGAIALCINLDLNIDVAEHIKPLYVSQIADIAEVAAAVKANRA